MDREKQKIVDDMIRNAVLIVYSVIKPYRKRGSIDDQDYQLILAQLKEIEKALIIIDTQLQ